jgi:2-C-methyl-D-erythritol 4-phosphate cytidylyltransferase/2-C-methyl-D-erythritol 2,4-cyclodiphosphate synthase
MFASAIIAAGGRGVRFGGDIPKQLIEFGGATLLERAVETFVRAACVHEVVVALPAELTTNPPPYLLGRSKPLHVVAGGLRRQDSVANAFERVAAAADVVVVHDAARPFASELLIQRIVDAARESGAAIAALPAHDTVKEAATSQAGEHAIVERTLARDRIFLAQTPQAFRREILNAAIRLSRERGGDATDEATLVERAGYPVRLVPGEIQNVKITTMDDWNSARTTQSAATASLTRIGTGYDLHRLVEGRPLVLAGVTIPAPKGSLGHSDGDVVCHSLTDAILGAAALGDIGHHFPDTDERWRGAAGLDLLARAVQLVRQAGFVVVNVDAVVILERPKLRGHLPDVCANLARTLGVDRLAVSVKGKTNEGLGEIGRGDAIAAHAVAFLMVQKTEDRRQKSEVRMNSE